MEVVPSVLNIIGSCCSLHEVVRTKHKHLRTLKRSIRQMNNLMQRLDAHERDVEHEINQLRAESTNVCSTWREQVGQVRSEVRNLMDENGRLRQTKWFSFICSRIKLGELVEEKIRDIRELIETVPDLKDVAIPVGKRGDILSATPMMGCETHKQIFMKIRGFLSDENVRRIGICGLGGAGKTTIMSEINNHLLNNSNEFNCIIWAEASKDLEKLQQI
ncbi:probable disease resistance protein At5g47250 [Prosopis cineraria]|uniref:probable disease resistance protein At5g47250 n=1 Tax=Prosopis cineraria TaxID=364024 RepID=UPI00240F3321|nr:probable disease resistance protein At5g47250 [Prosopis cineraria]